MVAGEAAFDDIGGVIDAIHLHGEGHIAAAGNAGVFEWGEPRGPTAARIVVGEQSPLGGGGWGGRIEGPEEHQKILDFLADHHISYLTVGPIFKALNAAGYANVTELKEILRGQQIKDKLILLKGSRGLALEQLLDCL